PAILEHLPKLGSVRHVPVVDVPVEGMTAIERITEARTPTDVPPSQRSVEQGTATEAADHNIYVLGIPERHGTSVERRAAVERIAQRVDRSRKERRYDSQHGAVRIQDLLQPNQTEVIH